MTTARPAVPDKKARSEGQWALGDREPLNPNEELKQAGAPFEVRERIENVYAKEGFDSIERRPARTHPLVGPVHPARGGLRRLVDRRRERSSRPGTS